MSHSEQIRSDRLKLPAEMRPNNFLINCQFAFLKFFKSLSSFLNNCQIEKFASTDEIDSKSGNKLDGNKIKSFSSGGDTVQMRTNFKYEKDLIVGCRLTMN